MIEPKPVMAPDADEPVPPIGTLAVVLPPPPPQPAISIALPSTVNISPSRRVIPLLEGTNDA